MFDRLRPRGYERESFAGKEAHPLDEERLAEFTAFVRDGLETLGVLGAALGIVEDGEDQGTKLLDFGLATMRDRYKSAAAGLVV